MSAPLVWSITGVITVHDTDLLTKKHFYRFTDYSIEYW